LDPPPPQVCEQREVRSAVEGQGPPAPTPLPPHEIASFLMHPAMLGGRDLAGRALNQRPQVFVGDSTHLDAKALALCVELRPVGETCGRHVEEPKQAAHCRGRLPQTRRPSGHPGFAGPGHHSDNRMTLAICTHATEGIQNSATPTLEETYSRSGC
jgi:hypothetical protein